MISILIPVFNTDVYPLVQELSNQLNSLDGKGEIIVYDDFSNELFKVQNRSATSLENVFYKELDKNYGRIGVRQMLAENARYDWLLFIDGDSVIINKQYLQGYLEEIDTDDVYVGGRVYQDDMPAACNKRLHWKYGTERESVKGNSNVFHTNNFCIRKDVFLQLNFPYQLTGYGHEDTWMEMELNKMKKSISFITNPVLHDGLEDTPVFLEKSKNALKNLLMLTSIFNEKQVREKVSLYNLFYWQRKLGLNKIISGILKKRIDKIEKNLRSCFPSLIPCLQFNVWSATKENNNDKIQLLQVVYSADEYVAEINSGRTDLSIEQWAAIAYSVASVVVLALFILALLRIRSIIRSHSIMRIDDIKFVNTEEKDSPFSFLNYIFWNRQIELNSPSGEHIFQHELVHVREKHSFDKIFLQLILIGCWCNPFFWLIRRELKMIHEFIADENSVGQSDAHAFAAMILQATYPNHYTHLTNQFFQSSIKRRLTMLTKKHNPKFNYLSRVLALPLFAFIVLAFTIKAKQEVKNITLGLEKEITVVIDAGHGGGTGVRIGNIYEDELVLQLAKVIRSINKNDQVKILLTRENENNVPLKERVKFAKGNGADLFISLHINAASPANESTKLKTSGYEVAVPSKEPFYQKNSELLGAALVQHLNQVYTTLPTLVKAGAWVLDQNVCPSVLIECGYLTDENDRDFIVKKENQELIAKKILSAIEVYATSRTTGKTSVNDESLAEIPNSDIKSESGQDTTVPKSMFFDTKNKIAIEFDEITHSTTPEKSTVHLTTAMLIVNGEKVPNDIFKRKTIITNKLKFIEGKDAVKIYGQEAALGAVVFEGARYIDIPVTEYYKDIFNPKEKVKSDPANKVFEKVEVEAEFPGGTTAWRRFLERNLNAQIPTAKKAPRGTYTVIAKFIVDHQGNISDVKTLTKHGYGMEEEVIRVIKTGPKWTPAIQNGLNVNAYRKQPITFVVAEK